MNKKMNAILETMPEDQRFIAKELADNFVFLSVRITELREAEAAVRHQLRQRRRADRLPREPQHIGVQQAGDAMPMCMKLAKLLPTADVRRTTGSLHRVVA
ncbi:MAG: hypothetical protein ACLTMP_09955 [Eggerthella lenta]